MAISIEKNSKESPDRLISRFNRKVQGSGVLKLVREKRYFERFRTKRKVRARAVKREEYRAKKQKLQYY